MTTKFTTLAFAYCLSCIFCAAQPFLVWDPSPDSELVTNYVVQAKSLLLNGTITRVNSITNRHNLNYLTSGSFELTVQPQNSTDIGEPSLPLRYDVLNGPASVSIRTIYTGGQIGITLSWFSSTNATGYLVQLKNLQTLTMNQTATATTNITFTVVPGPYQLSLITTNSVSSTTNTYNLGTTTPIRVAAVRIQ